MASPQVTADATQTPRSSRFTSRAASTQRATESRMKRTPM
jgi:hypothetical protein